MTAGALAFRAWHTSLTIKVSPPVHLAGFESLKKIIFIILFYVHRCFARIYNCTLCTYLVLVETKEGVESPGIRVTGCWPCGYLQFGSRTSGRADGGLSCHVILRNLRRVFCCCFWDRVLLYLSLALNSQSFCLSFPKCWYYRHEQLYPAQNHIKNKPTNKW